MITFEDLVLDEESPIYQQIIRYVKRGIVSGSIRDGEEMLSRRALSVFLGVNPNTIQKAYHLLEGDGIIVSRSGARSCVEVNEERIAQIRMSLIRQDTANWVRAMKQMGVCPEEAIGVAKGLWEETE